MHRMILDVESIGLYGAPFAVGWVVVETDTYSVKYSSAHWKIIDEGFLGYKPNLEGDAINWMSKDRQEDAIWVRENVLPAIESKNDWGSTEWNCSNQSQMLSKFFEMYSDWAKSDDFEVWADCLYPVEANFFHLLIESQGRDMKQQRKELAPYPFHEIATALFLDKQDPKDHFPRGDNEFPAHNPLCDARQSARLLMNALLGISLTCA